MNSADEAALAFADEQLGLQEEAQGDQNEMAGLHAVPSAGQGFILVTDKYGRAQLDQDSTFIVSRIQFLGTQMTADPQFGNPSFPFATQLGFSVRDAGASILVTISKWKQGIPIGGTPVSSNEVSESQFATIASLVPQSRDGSLSPVAQVDYVYTLSARWIVPRGSSIRVAFPEMPANGLTLASSAPIRQHRPQILFIGRKVYG